MKGHGRALSRGTGRLSGRKLPLATALVALLGLGAYVVGSITGELHPGSLLGLVFGIAAAVLLLLVMLYSVRRGLTRVRSMGRRKGYMQLHIWGGLLFLFLVLLHTGFRLPRGVFTWTLWGLSLWVVLSGVVGVLLQRSIPRILNSTATFEVHLHRIPELVTELRQRAESVAGNGSPRVRDFYERELAAEMAAPQMVGMALFRGWGGRGRLTSGMDLLRRTLPDEGVASLDELQALREAKRDMDVHFTLQRILRGWLWLHLPLSILLLGLVVLHVFFITYF